MEDVVATPRGDSAAPFLVMVTQHKPLESTTLLYKNLRLFENIGSSLARR